MILLTAAVLCLGVQGPVGWWRGDDGAAPTSAADSSGNNRPGTYTSGATTSAATFPPGLFNNDSVFQFDGTDDQVTVPHNAAFNLTGDMTVAFWVRKTSEPTDYVRYIGKGNPTNRTFGLWDENSGGGTGGRVLFQQFNNGATVVNYYSVGSIGLNTWTHVACTVSGNNCVIYLDGQNSNPGAGGPPVVRTGTPTVDTQPVRFGYGEIHTYHPGQMDEVRLFNRALSLTEIQTLAGLIPSAVPQNVRFPNTSPNATEVAWDAATGANTYVVQRSTSGGPFVTIASGITGLLYTDNGLTSGTNYTYVVYAVGLVNSADSPPNSIVIPFPAPRTDDHEEGLLDENCSCGAAGRGTPALWALLALLALGAGLRRL